MSNIHRKPCPDDVIDAVSDVLGLDRWELLRPIRSRPRMIARTLAIHVIRTLTPLSYPEIASVMGMAAHTSAIDADTRARQWIASGTHSADERVPQITQRAIELSSRPYLELCERLLRERQERDQANRLRRSA